MMAALDTLLSRPKVALTAAVLMAVTGLVSWSSMPRQEDPDMPDYWGQVVTPFPGADAETMERLVTDPIEEHLIEVQDVKKVTSTSRAEVSILRIELRDGVRDIDRAWDDVREALRRAELDLPEGVTRPALDRDLNDQDSIVLAVTGSADLLALKTAADHLKRELLLLPEVARVRLVGDPGEQITVQLDDAVAHRLGIDARALAAQLGSRNRILPGGTISLAGTRVTLRPHSEFQSIEEIRSTPIVLPSGASVPLGELARVPYGPTEPVETRMRLDAEPAVGLGIVPREGADTTALGRSVRQLVEKTAPLFAPLQIREMAFQPDWVGLRTTQLGTSLLVGILIVAAVLIASMGIRLGLVVTSVVPLVALSSLGVYALGGGVLHQISIAAVVIALGMLVDSTIVIAENVQTRLDAREAGLPATSAAVREMALPLASATGTTLAAFVPMLAAQGPTAEFTRAIPVMVLLTLSLSYVYAMLVTPVLSRYALKATPGRSTSRFASAARVLGRVAVGRPLTVLASVGVLVLVSFLMARAVSQQFFPLSDRNQFTVDLKLPEGVHLDATDAAALRFERALLQHPDVVSVAGFVGRSAPHFYYNLPQIPLAPNLAQLAITTTSARSAERMVAQAREWAAREMPGTEVVIRRLEQGPPVTAPVEVRLFGRDLEALDRATTDVLDMVRRSPGTVDIRHGLSLGAPSVVFTVDDAAAARSGLSREDVALALYGRTRGIPVGQYRATEDPVPVMVRSAEGEAFPAENLEGILVAAPGGSPIPVGQVASVQLEWRPAAIEREGRQRVARVLSQLEEGVAYSDVLRHLQPRLAGLALPEGVRWEFGGEVEGAGEASAAMVAAVPLAALLLLGILLVQFNSFRKVAIVLVTVPLAAAGVVPGLLAANQPFGFMSLLGIIALVGVVVNNAIVLLDLVDRRRAAGASVPDALRTAVERRARPILLTTATTIAGLLPLAFSPSSLWPPMAWAMISGLAASTILTLLAVPALYLLLFEPKRALAGLPRWAPSGAAALAIVLLAMPVPAARAQAPGPAEPVHLTLREAMERASARPHVDAARRRAAAANHAAEAERRVALLPVLNATAGVVGSGPEQRLDTPIGDFRLGRTHGALTAFSVAQPLFDPVRTLYTSRAARDEAQAASLTARRTEDDLAAAAAEAYLDVLAVDAAREATEAFRESLRAQLAETEARVAEGRALAADMLKVRLALDGAEQDLLALRERRTVALEALAIAIAADGPVEPVPHLGDDGEEASLLAEADADAFILDAGASSRADVAALELQVRALQRRAAGVRAEILPRVELRAGWTRNTASAFESDGRVEGAVLVTWNPLAAGTRSKRAAALAEEAAALQADLVELRRSAALEVSAARAAIETARGAVRVGERGVEQADETLRVERERFRAGRVTTNDLLEAEAALRDQRLRRNLARLDVVRARVRLELAAGR